MTDYTTMPGYAEATEGYPELSDAEYGRLLLDREPPSEEPEPDEFELTDEEHKMAADLIMRCPACDGYGGWADIDVPDNEWDLSGCRGFWETCPICDGDGARLDPAEETTRMEMHQP